MSIAWPNGCVLARAPLGPCDVGRMVACRANAEVFAAEYGIQSTLVPLGNAVNMEAYPPPLPEAERDIDVLFVGV